MIVGFGRQLKVADSRRRAIDLIPLRHGGPVEPGRMRDGGDVNEQVRRAAQGRMHRQGVVDRIVSQNVSQSDFLLRHAMQRLVVPLVALDED